MAMGHRLNARPDILAPAALFHDIGRYKERCTQGGICHADRGAEMAEAILRDLGYSAEDQAAICHCIRAHRFRSSTTPASLEAKILFDADKLDSMGAIGIGRAFLFAGQVGARLHNAETNPAETLPYSAEDTAYREFQVKMSKVRDQMLTTVGRELARRRHEFMETFFCRAEPGNLRSAVGLNLSRTSFSSLTEDNTMLKLVIFDCDGVMFDSREANRAYYNHILSRFDCPPMNEEEVGYVHIHNVMDSVRYIFRQHSRVDMEEVARYRQQLDYAPFLKYMIMAPDLNEFLKNISPKYHRAISTNRTNTMDMILDFFDLRSCFEIVMTASNSPRPKPAPDALHIILNHFGLTAAEAVFIGDSTVDQEHCASVGMDLIAFDNPELEARYHVGNFMEIMNLPLFTEAVRAG